MGDTPRVYAVLDGMRMREHGQLTDIPHFSKKKGSRLERRKPFTSYFLDWLRGSDLN
jgi:hypothetical protein